MHRNGSSLGHGQDTHHTNVFDRINIKDLLQHFIFRICFTEATPCLPWYCHGSLPPSGPLTVPQCSHIDTSFPEATASSGIQWRNLLRPSGDIQSPQPRAVQRPSQTKNIRGLIPWPIVSTYSSPKAHQCTYISVGPRFSLHVIHEAAPNAVHIVPMSRVSAVLP